MKHYGDITKIKGSAVEPVDVITGGSPCQDLSVAGKRAGLAGERSGLFMEQIRVIKELRENDKRNGRTDDTCRPRYMVWENVPGALSSGEPKGEDFRIVLEETCRVKDANAVIPGLAAGQKWSKCGCIVGDGYSVAWRTHDAQFWGVPQRRRRLCVLADFNGDTAGRILFELRRSTADTDQDAVAGRLGTEPGQPVRSIGAGVSGHTGESGASREGTPAGTEGSVGGTSVGCIDRGGGRGGVNLSTEQTPTLATTHDGAHAVFGISAFESNAFKSANPHSGVYKADTSRTLDNNGGNPACNQGGVCVLEGNGARESHKGDGYSVTDTCYTLNTVEQHAVGVDIFNLANTGDTACPMTTGGGQRNRPESDDR